MALLTTGEDFLPQSSATISHSTLLVLDTIMNRARLFVLLPRMLFFVEFTIQPYANGTLYFYDQLALADLLDVQLLDSVLFRDASLDCSDRLISQPACWYPTRLQHFVVDVFAVKTRPRIAHFLHTSFYFVGLATETCPALSPPVVLSCAEPRCDPKCDEHIGNCASSGVLRKYRSWSYELAELYELLTPSMPSFAGGTLLSIVLTITSSRVDGGIRYPQSITRFRPTLAFYHH